MDNGQLSDFVPVDIARAPLTQEAIPALARDIRATTRLQQAAQSVSTSHALAVEDSRNLGFLDDESIHLVLTSPPYWNLKRYLDDDGQLGHVDDYGEFHAGLDRVWKHCYRALVPGGRLVCVVGDVCRSRRTNNGVHTVVPLHARIQERCVALGYTNLAPIFWNKIANIAYEAGSANGGFLGKPYEPNAVVKNDVEYILMLRKPGGYRKPTKAERLLSLIPEGEYQKWFRQVWTDVKGSSRSTHPAPFPLELAERLVRMFSFVGDTVLDPFMGTGTTNAAAARWGRNSIGVDVSSTYCQAARQRLITESTNVFAQISVSELETEIAVAV